MTYLILDPTCKMLMDSLREADRQRDHLRAQLADAAMRAELAEVDRNLPWGLEPEKRAALKAEREAAIQARIAVRAARRANEMRIFGSYTRPGTWDADLDTYQEPRYEEALEGGYGLRLVRARDLTWNAYVILPAGHPAAGRDYDFFGYETPKGISLPPENLTYSTVEEGRGVFGFYLTGIVKPRDYGDYTAQNFYSAEKTGYSVYSGSCHVDYANMRTRCMLLVDYFKGLAADEGTAKICRDAARCPTHERFHVGACEACRPPPEPRGPLGFAAGYGTLDGATGVLTVQSRAEFHNSLTADIARAVAAMPPEPSLASRATLPKQPRSEPSLASRATVPGKKSWAAVAAGRR
jgi:hypothetical protein